MINRLLTLYKSNFLIGQFTHEVIINIGHLGKYTCKSSIVISQIFSGVNVLRTRNTNIPRSVILENPAFYLANEQVPNFRITRKTVTSFRKRKKYFPRILGFNFRTGQDNT